MNISVKLNVLKSQSSLVAYASVIFDNVMEIPGWRIIKGSKGLFVTPPQTKGAKPSEDGKDVYYDNVRFLDKSEENPYSAQMKIISDAVLKEYNAQSSANTRGNVASSRGEAEPAPTRGRPSVARNPAW